MNGRLKVVAFLFLIAFGATVGRLFFLQVFRYTYYTAAAEGQQEVEAEVEPRRGTIFIRSESREGVEHLPVALTKGWWHIWASPKDVPSERIGELTASLAPLVELDEERLRERLSKDGDPYEPLADKIDEETLEKIKALEAPGIHARPMRARYYPLGALASPVVGFVPSGEQGASGQYGIEEFFDAQLRGETGRVEGYLNPFGKLIAALSDVTEPTDGSDVYLTLDYNIQRTLETRLAKVLEDYDAEGVQGIILEPRTGRILAMASLPSFDPNVYGEVEHVGQFMNPAVQALFEPGSIFKPFTMATALDINVVSPELTYRDDGFVRVRDATIRNSSDRVEGVQTMTQVLEKSLNTGAVFALQRVPRGVWLEYLEKFALDEKTGISLPGEVTGTLRNLDEGGEVEFATSAFGQGIAVTPLAMLSGIAAVANDGILMHPYIVEKVVASDGSVSFEAKTQVRARVIEAGPARQLTQMLVSVVEKGSGQRARLDGYFVAGKTGTAQVASSEGGYSGKTTHSFVGYAPAFNPRFAFLVKIDNPQGVQYSEVSAGPVFHDVGSFILQYYNVEPDKPVSK